MADFNALETLINAYIKQNGVQAITGQVLNGVLRGMVSALGKGWTIAGAAEPNTDPGTMTGPVAYIAHTAGTYTDFGGLVVNDGEVAFLKYNEQTWTKEVLASLAATASVDGNVGTPSVTTQFVNGVLNFAFHNIKGDPGVDGTDGDAAGFGTVAATVDNTIGTPAVSVSASGPDTAKNFTFAFTGLKGATGVTSAVVTVDNTSGTPQCAVSLVGQELHLDFTGLKGAQGDTGSSVAYPFTIVNNVTTNDATQALSAAMGVQLESEISQLDLKVSNLSGKYYGFFEASTDLPDNITQPGYAFVGAEEPFAIYQFDGEEWADTGATANSIQGEPGVGFESAETPSTPDGTFIITLSNGDTMTIDLNHTHPNYFDKLVGSSIPSGGLVPDTAYKLGTLTGSVTITLASAVSGCLNHYYFTFDTSSTAPTITFPVSVTKWDGNCVTSNAPVISASKHYEVSILDGVGFIYES